MVLNIFLTHLHEFVFGGQVLGEAAQLLSAELLAEMPDCHSIVQNVVRNGLIDVVMLQAPT